MIIEFTNVESNNAEKELELIYERKYSNSHIWICIIVKLFKKIWKWY
jgi:hypothetical protein